MKVKTWYVQTNNMIDVKGPSGHAIHPDEVRDGMVGSVTVRWVDGIPIVSTYVRAKTYEEALDKGMDRMVKSIMERFT